MEHLEGRQSVLAALQARQRRIELVLLRHGMHEQDIRPILDAAAATSVPVQYVDSKQLEAMAHGSSHGGVIAVASAKPRMTVEQLSDLLDSLSDPPLLLLLEGVDDARNLGFTLRSAEALGVHAVLIKKHLWDFDSVEVARPSSGAYERMPLVLLDDVTPLKLLQKRGIQLVGCLSGAKRTIYDADLSKPALLAIGGEKRGLSSAVRELCDLFVTIPCKPDPSSLSLSHAAAIVMAEASRQRRSRSSPLPSGEG
jgi:23S rRNA (guanosine2251-2'-O)-methyltransferase